MEAMQGGERWEEKSIKIKMKKLTGITKQKLGKNLS